MTLVHIERNVYLPVCHLNFGSLNTASLHSKVDDILDSTDDIDVLLLCETWYDINSIVISFLHADGYSVVECARPRAHGVYKSLRWGLLM